MRCDLRLCGMAPAMASSALLCLSYLSRMAAASSYGGPRGLDVEISVANGLLNGSTDGRISLMFAPQGVDPLEDTDVTSSPNRFYGKNVYDYGGDDSVVFSGGSGFNTRVGVYGYPNVSLNDVEPGDYTVQAFLNRYETVKRSDGSVVSVRFPCGDGAPNVSGYGVLLTSAVNVTVTGDDQRINLTFDNITASEDFMGNEIGGCSQGNYEDTKLLKYVKIRSQKLSDFWTRDMYVGANVLLPPGYDAEDGTQYPVVYSQGHWPGDSGAYRYGSSASFTSTWNNGIIVGANGTSRPTPKFIMVTFRHEAPFYDDSYGVNTANMGPYGDAINDELIPHIDSHFNTVAEPYGRITEGGSTGGWISAANVIYRPDLFGACFSSYPDSLDFHSHQAIPLLDGTNAYTLSDGTKVPSIRTFENGTEVVLATTEMENHWELTFGTSSRSFLQWDAWNAVFGAQGLNGYPLEPWNKVTGEIYPDAVAYWRPFDLSSYITSNWDNRRNLRDVLRNRINVYVGSHDTYYLNLGVERFRDNVASYGGPDWANVTILPDRIHGGNYNGLDTWKYLELLKRWFEDHAPNGKTPLTKSVTTARARGNIWEEIIAAGGHQAAVKRQVPPGLHAVGRSSAEGSVGRWDPGVELHAQWSVDGKLGGKPFEVKQGRKVKYVKHRKGRKCRVQLIVTGKKMGYLKETRYSNTVSIVQ